MDCALWPVNIIIYFVLLSTYVQTAWGYYCEWDYCGSDQYCCGDNLCCEYVYSLWYFWVGILFVVILLSACGGLFRYCYYHSPHVVIHRITNYVPVPNIGTAEEHDRFLVDDNDASFPSYSQKKPPSYSPPQGPPPPYSASASSNVLQHNMKHNPNTKLSIYP